MRHVSDLGLLLGAVSLVKSEGDVGDNEDAEDDGAHDAKPHLLEVHQHVGHVGADKRVNAAAGAAGMESNREASH